ncbi:MAG: DUF3078 domain-containing protein [Fluviicola sp.]
MRFFLLTLGLLAGSVSFSQEESDTTNTNSSDTTSQAEQPKWLLKSIYGLNGTNSSFVNWNAGGRNNISLLGFVSATAVYNSQVIDWDNSLDLALGGLQYLDDSGEGLQKTDDRIELSSKIGYRLKQNRHYYLSFLGSFRTQFLDGFNLPNDSVRVSTFMAPGYVNLALGINYKPTENLSLFLSPASAKMTFVRDQTLANAGAFGVEPAAIDTTTGTIITPGSQFRPEFGAYFRMIYNKEIAKNIEMKSRLELFSNYLDRPQNIDVNADVLFNFKVNSWFSASANFTLIYDHDILITDSNGNTGPRTQFKSVLGVGISYTMKNFSEKKKEKKKEE